MLLNEYTELTELGQGQFQQEISIKPIAFYPLGSTNLVRINSDFVDGDEEYPHVVHLAPYEFRVTQGGKRRWYFAPGRWFEVGNPVIRDNGGLKEVDLGQPNRNGNRLIWPTAHTKLIVDHIGHGVKLGVLWDNNDLWRPPQNEFAFALSYSDAGVERVGRTIKMDGEDKLWLNPFTASDYADPDAETIHVSHDFLTIAGQEYVRITLPPETNSYQRLLLDPTLTLQPGAAAGLDTRILASVPAGNYGIAVQMIVGNHSGNVSRGLIEFDISSLPVGATLISAVASLYCRTEANATNRDVGFHKAITEWYEGDAVGGAPSGDGSTWALRNNNGAVAWAGGAGGGSGADWTAIATDTTTITGTGVFFNWNVLADVNSWYGGANNYGWWLINTDEVTADTRKNFSSSDNVNAPQRPKLVIVYSLGLMPQLQKANLGSDMFDGALIV